MKTKMMKIDFDGLYLVGKALDIAKEIVKKDGTLYSSRPQKASGEAQYVWRMVVFSLSSKPQHQCIPATADWYLGDDYWKDMTWKERSDYRKYLDMIADAVVKTVPVTSQPGTLRWGRALGMI